jgi:hypothetical protein
MEEPVDPYVQVHRHVRWGLPTKWWGREVFLPQIVRCTSSKKISSPTFVSSLLAERKAVEKQGPCRGKSKIMTTVCTCKEIREGKGVKDGDIRRKESLGMIQIYTQRQRVSLKFRMKWICRINGYYATQ